MRKTRNSKGQVSIFLIFLFQVLFVFFAMVVNVGMLVYYKINLQNSVDLAAYYAAMKQAEMLNTIGHINYQMRQSWKLLAYRATILGTLGPDDHPARPQPVGSDIFGPIPQDIPYIRLGAPVFPVFCVTIAEIYANAIGQNGSINESRINEADNHCRFDFSRNLPGFKIPDVIWALPGYNQQIRDGSIILQNKFLDEFSSGGFRNYANLAAFIIAFRADSLNRRKVIGVLANSMSKDLTNFYDIESQSVSMGAQRVLQKNLSDQNNAPGFSMELYNSLADQNCGGPNPDIEGLPGWLKEIEVAAIFAYMDSIVNDEVFDGPDKALQNTRYIGIGPSSIPFQAKPNLLGADAYQNIQELDKLIYQPGFAQHSAGRWTSAVGIEKNPWCMPYVGVKATSSPRLPFMPARFAPILQAKSFAKPFGSRIGPWYGRSWPDRNPNSSSDKNLALVTDGKLPPRIFDGMSGPPPLGPNDFIRFFSNYSRYVGDSSGLLSQAARFGYGKFYWKKHPPHPYWTAMWKGPLIKAFDQNRNDSSPFFMGPPSGDILADAYQKEFFPASEALIAKDFAIEMRRTEIAAIAPDLFDITYYPIEPRFNQFMLPRVEKFIQNFNTKRPNLMVRGDLGWRSPNYPGEPGIADTSANIDMHIEQFAKSEFSTKNSNQIFQTITKPEQILTSWAETSILDYAPAISAPKIGKCDQLIPKDNEPWAPGACVKGGRTGYSVKLVSKKFLSGQIPSIGGQGIDGTILNPPSPSF